MHPRENLTVIAAAKSALRLRIACRRIRCADALVHVARPLVWLDQAQATWRRIAPFARLAAATWRSRPRDGFGPRTRVLLDATRLAFDVIRRFRQA